MKKQTDPAIKKHFSDMAKKSWAVRRKKILEKAEKSNQNKPKQ